MNSSMISKIAKAKRYAEEPERIQFTRFEAKFNGENDVHTTTFDNGEWDCTCRFFQVHTTTFDNGEWDCTCRFFQDWGDCSHTMAMQRVLGVTIPAPYRQGIPSGIGTSPLVH